ncbi:MAG: ATP-binding cassette domain-containing protein [Candidatus Hydrothermae bacterium]|nr:ATP-binding cassette domain-containing protein [Candidatus Hydrothermae bacterium]
MVEVQGLVKRYGSLTVLHGVDVTFPPGVTALVGPNASGKTTLLKCILGLVIPQEGILRVMGETVTGHPEIRRHIGYMPQMVQFPENLTVKEILAWVQDLRSTRVDLEPWISWVGLDAFFDKPFGYLSGGTRQKVGMVAALMLDTPVLILDEPTAGLDPLSNTRFKEKIREERDRGKTIILTSHILSELEGLADRVVFLLEGDIIFEGSREELLTHTGQPDMEQAIAHLMQQNGSEGA